jgi:hypothetical protein
MMFYDTNVTFIFCGWGSEEELCHTLYTIPLRLDLTLIQSSSISYVCTCITVRRERLIFKLLFLWFDIYATHRCIG